MSQSAWCVLVTGDIFIPSRACAIPKKIKQKIDSLIITDVVCTGNLTSLAAKNQLLEISQNILMCRGPLDDVSALAEDCMEFGPVRIGVLNGSSIVPRGDVRYLAKHAIMMDCQVLCTGGELGVERFGDLVIVRSGSLTGVEQDAGFAVLKIENKKLSVQLYKQSAGKLSVETIDCGKCDFLGEEQAIDEHYIASGVAEDKKTEQFIEQEYGNDFNFDA